MTTLYMVVTKDKYELPLIVSERVKDIAEYEGVTTDDVHSALSKKRKYGRKSKYDSVKVDMNED